MTVSSITSSIIYGGDGIVTIFSVPFYWITDSHIVVELYNPTGPVTTAWVQGTNYTLSGAGNFAGGTLTATVAPAVGLELRIRRILPILQLSDFVSNDTLPAETVERDYDYLTMVCQQLSDSIALLGSGSAISFQNVGASGVSSYAGMSGTVAQFKKIVGASGIVASESATQITLTGSGAGVDLAADYPWTGLHTHTKQAARTAPSWIIKSLQGGVDIADSSILLASDYSTAMDVRKRTDVSVEAPVDASWGGNAGIYIQHSASGTTNANGTLTCGIRAQMETTQVKGGGASVNDAVGGYFSIYNNGTDVGGFGMHIDAYHVGTAGAAGHTTYGMSVEAYKNIAGGVAAGILTRSLGTQAMDYGVLITSTSGGLRFNRGLQIGCPTYANGGVAGSPGTLLTVDVGIDLSWCQVLKQAISIPALTRFCWSGVPQAQSATPDKTCESMYDSGTGIWWMMSASAFKFGVNMTTGNLFGPGTNEQLSCWDTTQSWVLSFTSTNKVASTANGGTQVAGVTATALSSSLLAGFIIMKIGGTTVKVPYLSN